MNYQHSNKYKSRSIISYIKSNNNRERKIRKKSPKTIEYNKLAEKYGNLLETSLNTSDDTQSNKLNKEKGKEDSYYDYIIDNIYNDNYADNNKTLKPKYNNIKESSINNNNIGSDSMFNHTFKQKRNNLSNMDYNNNRNEKFNNMKYKKNASLSISKTGKKYYCKDNKYMFNTFSNQLKRNTIKKIKENESNDKIVIDKLINNIKNNKSCNNIKRDLSKGKDKEKKMILSIMDNDNTKYKKNLKETKEEINVKTKEKIMLLLNICRKFANKFNKLFPLCENSIKSYKNINDKINHNSLKELKNTIIQYNNMIFNDGITKLFGIDKNNLNNFKEINVDSKKIEDLENNNKKLSDKNEKLNLELKKLSNKIISLKTIEYKYNQQIKELKNKIEFLNNEINKKDEIIKNLENSNNKNSLSSRELNDIDSKNSKINKVIKLNNRNEEILTKIEKIKNKMTIDHDNFDLSIEENKPKRLSSEMEQLDQEIFNLKSKLKRIIKK